VEQRVAVLARIKKFLPIKYHIILFNASIKPFLSTAYQFGQAVIQDYWLTFLKFKNYVLVLDAPLQARTLPLFHKLGWLPINHICIERRLILFKKILDGRAPDYLSEKLLSMKYYKSYDKRSRRMPYRLPIPRTNSRKRMFFFNALQLWKNISDNDFVYSTDLKKFGRNYFDNIMRKFTPDSFKTDRIV